MNRTCFIVLADQCNSIGYIPSLVTENEAGHSPLIGNGPFSEPWYWGRPGMSEEGWVQAQRVCAEENARLGLTPDDVEEIVSSSIIQTIRERAAHERLDDVLHQILRG